MSCLLKIRSERGQMSAIERRIADFILENAHLMRDYSSQQLANTLKISQSSVVKFCQRLGFKGYPDLKISISEALIREDVQQMQEQEFDTQLPKQNIPLAQSLWQLKAQAEQETRVLNSEDLLASAVKQLRSAGTVYVLGTANDGRLIEPLALTLSLLGIRCIVHTEPSQMLAALSSATRKDILFVLSEHGFTTKLLIACQDMKAKGGRLISLTRNTSNPIRNQADTALLVSAHDHLAYIEEMLYQSAVQHMLDVLNIQLIQAKEAAVEQFESNFQRIRQTGNH